MNVVFDLGGVLLTWDPESIVSGMFSDPHVQELVLDKVFKHPDWLELDRGTLDPQVAVDQWTERTGLPRADMDRLMAQVPHALAPMDDSIALLPRLKQNGHPLYCLSNMHTASIAHLEESYSFFDHFGGAVVSCRIHAIKPEPEIYSHLLETFDLEPRDTVFIDDMEYNLTAAAEFGIRTILFWNAGQCERDLIALGCL